MDMMVEMVLYLLQIMQQEEVVVLVMLELMQQEQKVEMVDLELGIILLELILVMLVVAEELIMKEEI